MLETAADFGRTLLYLAAAVGLIGAVSHALGWLVTRRGTAQFVWRAWNLLGALLLVGGIAAMAYGWWGLGLHTGAGSVVLGMGLLLASAGLWMLVPI